MVITEQMGLDNILQVDHTIFAEGSLWTNLPAGSTNFMKAINRSIITFDQRRIFSLRVHAYFKKANPTVMEYTLSSLSMDFSFFYQGIQVPISSAGLYGTQMPLNIPVTFAGILCDEIWSNGWIRCALDYDMGSGAHGISTVTAECHFIVEMLYALEADYQLYLKNKI